MEQLPQEGLALILLVFVLGMKHGLDADHLATIDGMTRYNAPVNPALARFCGVLFSLGHGAVVVAVATIASWAAKTWTAPEWMESFGVFTSIFFLSLLGCANLLAVLRTPANQIVQPVGVKGRFLGSLQRAGRPSLIALVGALFALSFDTMSQAALFALSARQEGEFWRAPLLGGIFMFGMLVTDGLNGLWISRVLRRADRMAVIASRVMGLTVATLSLAVAALAAAKYCSPAIGGLMEGLEMQTGLAVFAAVCIALAAGMLLSHRRAGKVA
ncbi:MAG: nickel transporter [Proteobacteria bacterium]|nr:nickel transporter [Pseudomonadota bacterium]